MAHIRSLSRVVVSAVKVTPRPGSSVAAAQLTLGEHNQPPEKKNDLCSNLSRLGITPLEARLSSQVVTSTNLFKWSQHSTPEIRLPSLIKPVSITVPTLYNGGLLEKDLPPLLNYVEKIEPTSNKDIVEAPASEIIEKQAARLIVIRKRKMRKHKLRKLRKKMRFLWLKVRQKREYRKEKLFQATEMIKVRAYEAFDAAQYVADVLRKAKEEPIPMTWRGKRLPQPIIKELMEKEQAKKEQKRIRRERRNQFL